MLDVDLVPSARGSVAGVVTADGTPVQGAVVTGTGPQEWSEVSGADGAYASGPLLPGDYLVTVEADGYVPVEQAVTVIADQVTEHDVELAAIDIAVLGDWEGELTAMLVRQGMAATELAWSGQLDLAPYEVVVVVNGGDPDQVTFDALLAAAEADGASLVYTGTWGVDQGGIRLLERFTDRVEVGAQGYGEGRVKLIDFDRGHPLFSRIRNSARLIGPGGYYSLLESYAGTSAAHLRIADAEPGEPPTRGLGVAYDWLAPDRVEILLSASAVTGTVGPGNGWTRNHERLLVDAVEWARVAEAPPAAPLRSGRP